MKKKPKAFVRRDVATDDEIRQFEYNNGDPYTRMEIREEITRLSGYPVNIRYSGAAQPEAQPNASEVGQSLSAELTTDAMVGSLAGTLAEVGRGDLAKVITDPRLRLRKTVV